MDYQVKTKDTAEADVVVAGGGPAGVGASIAAARSGLRTLLIEATGFLGGVSTAGALPFFLGAMRGSRPFPEMIKNNWQYKDLPRPKKAVDGIFGDFMRRVKTQNGGVGPSVVAQTDQFPALDRFGCHDEFTFDIEAGKRVLDEMAVQSGLRLSYYTHAIDVKISGNSIAGVYIHNKSGVRYIPCKAVIDCTGDADLIAAAGFETYVGDKETGEVTGANLVAHIENLDMGKIEQYIKDGGDPWFEEICKKAQAENPEMDLPDRITPFPMIQPGVLMINSGSAFAGYLGINGDAMTELTVRGRQRARLLTEVMFKKYIPGGANARLRLTATIPGVRETRRIVGETTLTEEALVSGTVFTDTIALGGRHFDLHRESAKGQPAGHRHLAHGAAQIPYGALIPKGSCNILAAGRCIAADGQAMGPARIMSTCMAVGEAAGTAAFFKVKNGCDFKSVNVAQLQDTLRKNGAIIDL
ncbi:MAG: FAD-dependent oxidoreductase [Oscillospiraceae bacterium]|nr:FAD-dependent oxidoreductase [Oscillospiraceae bacterium]